MASLLLSNSEADILAKHVNLTTENLLKLHPKTPEPVVFFQAGKLPGEALLHLKQLTLFGMICHLGGGNILNNLALKLHQPRSKATKTGLLKFAPIVLSTGSFRKNGIFKILIARTRKQPTN